MKRIYSLILILVSFLLVCGCNKIKTPDIKPVNLSLSLNYYSDFYDLTVPDGLSWEITSCPEWVSPEQMTGDSGTDICIYVSTNIGDMSRTGELKISCPDKTVTYTLAQMSRSDHDENSIIVSNKALMKTYGVGYGVNVFKDGKQSKYNLCSGVVDPTKLIKALNEFDESDALYEENQYYSRTESHIGNKTSDISTSLSVGAGIDLDISGFKASIEGKFTQNESTHEEFAYALRQIQHIVGSRYLRAGVLRTFAQKGVDVFEYDMTKLMSRIKDNPGDKNSINMLVDTYGTHVVVHGLLGGELELALEMRSSEKISETDIHAALDLSASVINAQGSVDMGEKEEAISQNTKISFRSYGGTNLFTFAPGSSFEDVLKETMRADKLNAWVAKIKEQEQLSLVDIGTCPIYDLMPTPEARDAVRNYIVNDYQKKNNGHGPQIYAVKGFTDSNNAYGSLEIEDINVRLEYYNEKVPEIKGDGLSTIIYSGTLDKMNYDCGFFIGDSLHKPGKLRKNRDGSFTYEPFDGLELRQIKEVYVDPTGAVTMSPKITDNYISVEFESVTNSLMGNWISTIECGVVGSIDDLYYLHWQLNQEDCSIACLSRSLPSDMYEMTFSLSCLECDRIVFKYYRSWTNLENNLIGTHAHLVEKYNEDSKTVNLKLPKGTKHIGVYLYNDYIDFTLDDMSNMFRDVAYEPPLLYYAAAYITTPRWKE